MQMETSACFRISLHGERTFKKTHRASCCSALPKIESALRPGRFTPVDTDTLTANQAITQRHESFVFDAQKILLHLQRPTPRIFWTDFLATMAIAYTAFAIYQTARDYSALQAASLILSGIALYRAVVFIHEIAHRPPNTFRAFTLVWNLLCGVPLLIPSFLYGDHKSHHSHQSYGTFSDAEYVFVTLGRQRSIAFLLMPFIYPFLVALRFLLLTPAAVLVPRIDRAVWTCASSLYMTNRSYRRHYDSSSRAASRWLQEGACSIWIWTIVWLTWMGKIQFQGLLKTYLVFLFWMGLNQLRTLVAHRYVSDGSVLGSGGQVVDSNTFAIGSVFPNLWAPLGLRYHALHHLMPTLPYHAMGRAHRELMTCLPSDSPYHKTLQTGFWSCLRKALSKSARTRASSNEGASHTGSSQRPPPRKR